MDSAVSTVPPAVSVAKPPGRAASPIGVALHGPIAPTILRLGLPTLLVLAVQTLLGVAEAYFVSFLGTDALAGAALVFPVLMLMQMMSNGGIGGGVAAAIARALGAGKRDEAEALALHALVLGLVFGLVFMGAALAFGAALYGAMGGDGGSLAMAVSYSNAIFFGAIPLWITSLLAAALRGAGDVRTPAAVVLGGTVVLLPLSPALIFGWGPLPRLGISGAGLAVTRYYLGAALYLLRHLLSPGSALRLRRVPLERRLFGAILGVGGLSAIGTVQANLTVVLVTSAIGFSGAEAIAGYGIASRLDYLLIPLLFGLGTASVTMVGASVGAGDAARARRVAWTGAALGGGGAGLIGLAAALYPVGWAGLFTSEPGVLATSALYLHIVGPSYVFFGAGMMLYFASQGAGRVLLPVLAGTARLGVSALILFLAARGALAEGGLFAVVAAGSVFYGLVCMLAVRLPSWGTRKSAARS
jgi:putative MATE family efflux protein